METHLDVLDVVLSAYPGAGLLLEQTSPEVLSLVSQHAQEASGEHSYPEKAPSQAAHCVLGSPALGAG